MSHAYRLLDHAQVLGAFEDASPQLGTPVITEHQARHIKPHLQEALQEVEEAVSPMRAFKSPER